MFLFTLEYILIFSIMLLLARRCDRRKDKTLTIILYVFFFAISALRYDIGNDYYNYFHESRSIAQLFSSGKSILDVYEWYDGRFELGFIFLNKLFAFSNSPFVWVNFVFSGITTYICYYLFTKYNSHFWGLLYMIISGYLFWEWDGARQGTAVIIYLCALDFLHDKKYWKFVLLTGLAFLFHSSAIYMIIAFPFVFIKLKNYIYAIVILGAVALYWSGFVDDYVENISLYFEFAEGYEKYATADATLEQFTSINYKLRTTLYAFVWLSITYALPKEENLYKNLIVVGAVIFVVGGGSNVFSRVAWYFVICSAVSLPIAIKNKNQILRLAVTSTLFLLSILYIRDIYTGTNTRGCVPYETILSDDFKNGRFRPRAY